MKKLSKEEKRILQEDIRDLKWLADKYVKEGQLSKAADCEKERKELQKKLKGNEYGI